MVMEVQPVADVDEKLDLTALRMFFKALELLGGPRKLIEYRNLTWLPSLMEACYAIVLYNDYMKSDTQIAEFLGLTRNTVTQILRADPELFRAKMEGQLDEKVKTHTAGALAKIAYEEIKQGRDNIQFMNFFMEKALEAVGYTWPIEVLVRIKGVQFPAEKAVLTEKLSGLEIKGVPAAELLERIPTDQYPVNSPAQLLHDLRVALEQN